MPRGFAWRSSRRADGSQRGDVVLGFGEAGAGCAAPKVGEPSGPLVLEAGVRASARLAQAPSFQEPITVYTPDSAGAIVYRSATLDYSGREGEHESKPTMGRRRRACDVRCGVTGAAL